MVDPIVAGWFSMSQNEPTTRPGVMSQTVIVQPGSATAGEPDTQPVDLRQTMVEGIQPVSKPSAPTVRPAPSPRPAPAVQKQAASTATPPPGESPAPAAPVGKPPPEQRGGKKRKTVAARAAAATPVYRPQRRAGVPVLIAVDDGSVSEGERFRLRGDRFAIGRIEGDLKLRGDSEVSRRHAELVRQDDGDQSQWWLIDRKSTNGTFVRVRQAMLWHGAHLMIGSGRYLVQTYPESERVVSPVAVGDPDRPKSTESPTPPTDWSNQTMIVSPNSEADVDELELFSDAEPGGFGAAQPGQRYMQLVDLTDTSRVWRFDPPHTDFGRQLALGRNQIRDPFIEPLHGRIELIGLRWRIREGATVNGCWLRMPSLKLKSDAQFQVGEQRFHFILNAKGPNP